MVGPLDFLCQWHLTSYSSDRVSAREAVSFLEARNLGVAVGGDHDGAVHSLIDASFEEERYVVDHHSVRVFFCRLFCQPCLFVCDTGVDDVFKPAPLGPVSENKGSQLTAIEGAVSIEDGLAECFHDFSPGRFAGFDNLMGQFVGIDHNRAALFEHPGDGALAGGDAACEAD